MDTTENEISRTNLMRCRVCSVMKQRNQIKIGGRLRLVDENRNPWFRNSICGECYKNRREKEKLTKLVDTSTGEEEISKEETTRNCRKCAKPMVNRYFHCAECVKLPEENIEYTVGLDYSFG